jgi:hypothetical protein
MTSLTRYEANEKESIGKFTGKWQYSSACGSSCTGLTANSCRSEEERRNEQYLDTRSGGIQPKGRDCALAPLFSIQSLRPEAGASGPDFGALTVFLFSLKFQDESFHFGWHSSHDGRPRSHSVGRCAWEGKPLAERNTQRYHGEQVH